MSKNACLQPWIMDALSELGEASVTDVAKHIWDHREADLRASGDLFYTWQYAMRWEAQKLQDAGKLTKNVNGKSWAVA